MNRRSVNDDDDSPDRDATDEEVRALELFEAYLRENDEHDDKDDRQSER
jgi:hypothetical protein